MKNDRNLVLNFRGVNDEDGVAGGDQDLDGFIQGKLGFNHSPAVWWLIEKGIRKLLGVGLIQIGHCEEEEVPSEHHQAASPNAAIFHPMLLCLLLIIEGKGRDDSNLPPPDFTK